MTRKTMNSWSRMISRSMAWRTLVFLLALGVVTGADAQESDDGFGRSLHWSRMAVAARLDADGRLHVRELQAMVFDGSWNGAERTFDLRLGQELRVNGIYRIDPATGDRIPLTRSSALERVDEYDRIEGNTLRWRSRLESDPPFRDQEIVYELDYSIGPVVFPAGDGYRMQHDFAFAGRDGTIERFDVDLTLDPAWSSPAGDRIREGMDGLVPGRGYTLDVSLDHVAPGEPAEAAIGAPAWVRTLAMAAALLTPLLVFFGLRGHQRELDRIAPITPASEITGSWLARHIFAYPPEVVGASWDRSIGAPEVAALLARLVSEGKLASRVEEEDGKPVLHLRRIEPLNSFAPHERDLLTGLFFDGSDETDTESIREHYEKVGFDPATKIGTAIASQLDELPGAGRVSRGALPGVGLALAGVVVTILGAGGLSQIGVALGVLGAVVFFGLIAILLALILSKRVTRRTGPAAGVLVTLTLATLPVVVLASGTMEAGMPFYSPGATLLLGLVGALGGMGLIASRLARSPQTPERLEFRRRLVSAREFFEQELERPEPRLEDAWFPYLLAFGLGAHVDRWFREFGGPVTGGVTPVIISSGGSAGRGSSGGWSGGGVQFGGGSWGGGGAGGSWGVAVAGMAQGVSPPSSGGGGGGGGASGGGSGGGW